MQGRFLGTPGEDVSVLAFRGGAFDTVMYLGVIQAWLLLKRPPPNLVTGVSAGGIAAAAMAEVYQAGEGRTDAPARHEQARRLRELVLAYISAPRELLQAWFPDTYEVNADRPLIPLQLPTQFEAERHERNDAVKSKFGLIKLFNTVLAVDFKVSVITRVIRHVLEILRLREEHRWRRRWLGRLKTLAALWLTGTLHPFSSSLLLRTFFGAISGTRHDSEGHTAADLLSYAQWAFRRTIAATGRVLALAGFVALWILPPLAVLVLALSWSSADWGWASWTAALDLSILAITGAVIFGMMHTTDSIAERLLRRFDLDAELASSYDLQQFLVRHFDPSYYGDLDVARAVDRALDRSPCPQTSPATPKLLGRYHDTTSMCVAPAVADLGTGELRLLGPEVSVVESLMASMAVAPFFKARTLKTGAQGLDYGHSFVDGMNVANEPISALMDYLRAHLNENAGSVTIYTVAPFSANGVGTAAGDFSELMDVVDRVLAIQGAQTVELERATTDVYSRLLPRDRAVTFIAADGKRIPYVNARIQPLDADTRLDINGKLGFAQHQSARAKIIYRGIAAGCRATLCEGLGEYLPQIAMGADVVNCRAALRYFWNETSDDSALHLSGSAEGSGPGLAEVCRECAVTMAGAGGPTEFPVSLIVRKTPVPPTRLRRKPGPPEPWVTMALSGGVFRGVFQLGVLNALSELNVRPRLIAGSSVGSIMAAFAARLAKEHDPDTRRLMMRSAAETFLSLDLLIPTDRFADFIRRFTLRAGAAGFSIKDADLLFRRYDIQRQAFGRTARRVLAGFERLFYVTPFEVRRMTEALRQEDFEEVSRLGKRYLQDFLERSGIGLELLGAEPLRLLIDHLVFQGSSDGRKATLEYFQPEVALILTATNLNQGDLRVFGMGAANGTREPSNVNLMEALLASSAFPGVFRPRSFAEVTPYETCGEVLVDGGVTDNLPLHSVARFLAAASDQGSTTRRPRLNGRPVPHLLLTASLEPKWSRLSDEEAAAHALSWLKVHKRTAQLRWNRKVDSFAKAQHDIRNIWNSGAGQRDWTPIDLEVITIKPEWLPPTFGFHPMLGFRRSRQAESIAHGCASTMAKLAHIGAIGPESGAGWRAEDWGFSVADILPQTVEWNPTHRGEPWTREPLLTPVATVTEQDGDPNLQGRCWFRGHARCPFFSDGADSHARELNAIYTACGDERTHHSRQ
jgi:predicted acylesterase/phospholipase RssA